MGNFEKVEAYFNNELSNSEKNDFLSEVASNTDLKSKFDFQKEVINGIKEARKAELKAMLNKVPVVSVGTTSSALYKILAGGVATILIGTSIWYYINDKNNTSTLQEINVISLNTVEPEKQIIKEEVNTSSLNSDEKVIAATEMHNTQALKSASPKIITPNLPTSEDVVENKALPEETLDIPEAINNGSINLSSKVNVKVKFKKKYVFHYQYSNKGITLYGHFEEGLFEILELNKEETRTLYLYYESNYYYINDNSSAIQPLKPVTDKKIKLKLEGLR